VAVRCGAVLAQQQRSRGAVHHHRVVHLIEAQVVQHRQQGAVGTLQIAKDGARRRLGDGPVVAARHVQGARPQMPMQPLLAVAAVPERRLQHFDVGPLPARQRLGVLHQALGGLEAIKLRGERRRVRRLGHAELSGGHVDVGEGEDALAPSDCTEIVVLARPQQLGLADGAGGHHPHHLSLH
jgi:hypothetical protein